MPTLYVNAEKDAQRVYTSSMVGTMVYSWRKFENLLKNKVTTTYVWAPTGGGGDPHVHVRIHVTGSFSKGGRGIILIFRANVR